jgi:putative MFS transporter
MSKDAPTPRRPSLRLLLHPVVLVGSLGYLVDIYDLVLFSIVRSPSLTALGVARDGLANQGLLLLNLQMAGMLVGGIIWGVLGDKKGRRLLLFGSIALYSAATLANAFVHTLAAYRLWRVLAGLGLAGELGGSMTLVSELLPKELRGYGTMLVATVGVSGAVIASLIADTWTWRVAYVIGGVLGFALLALRVGVLESPLFEKLQARADVPRGNFGSFFTSANRLKRYLCCVLIGAPLWYAVGIVVTLCPEFAQALHVQGAVTGSRGILFVYAGLVAGDFLSGTLSQLLNSRKAAVLLGLLVTAVFLCAYFASNGRSAAGFYWVIFGLGIGVGYWAVFATIAAEQFGTNLRATAATTVPNFARGALIPISLFFGWLKASHGLVDAGMITGAVCLVIAAAALYKLRETYGIDLDYVETA